MCVVVNSNNNNYWYGLSNLYDVKTKALKCKSKENALFLFCCKMPNWNDGGAPKMPWINEIDVWGD